MLVQVGDGGARVLEPLDDHPLQALAEHRLDGALHAGRDLEQIGDGADDAGQRVTAAVGEDRAHTGAVAFARALELGERLEARAAGRQRDPRVGELRLGLRQTPLGGGLLRCELLAPLFQRDQLGGRPITRRRQGPALAGEPRGLGLRLGELGGEPLGATTQLDLPLAQLARAPHEIDALRGESRLLQAQRLGVVALESQRGAVTLQGGLELRRRA